MVKKTVLWDALFPRRCPVCDDAVAKPGVLVCPSCRARIQYIQDPCCQRCGKQLREEKEYCEDCEKRNHYFVQGRALYDYGSMSDSVFRFKNAGRKEYADFFAEDLYIHYHNWLHAIQADALIPVPIHRDRMQSRGYNQAQEIADRLSDYTGIPCYSAFVERCRKTVPLKELSFCERQNNLKKAFKLLENDVKLNTIVIIDDVYTTGSTIDAIARVVMEHRSCKIFSLTLTIGRG